MGCRLYLAARLHVILCGVSGRAAKESHPRRKGCSVIPVSKFIFKRLSITTRTSRKTCSSTFVVPRKMSIRLPRVGHSCIVLGFTIGESRSGIRHPPHTHIPFKKNDVENNRRRKMYVSRSPELQQSSRNWCRTPARRPRSHPWHSVPIPLRWAAVPRTPTCPHPWLGRPAWGQGREGGQ